VTGPISAPRVAGVWIDGVIVVVMLTLATIAGSWSWNRSVARSPAFFYQSYYEPAVMVACGKGFVVAQPQVPAMAAFLEQRVDRFSCDDIPPDAKLGTEGLYQTPWRYLMVAVGLAWRILGISWSGMGPFFGTLFAVTIAAGYGIFRLGMGRPLAVLGACALSVSALQLSTLPRLRDYAKAPFTLILIFLLGLLVTRRSTWKAVLAIATGYGVVLGIGYGFRTDVLASIPPFYVALIGFLKGGVFQNIRLKVAAGLLCAATFLASGWPIVSTVYRSGGCQWHAALLGFSRQFSGPLGVAQPPYDLSRRYSDNFVYVTGTSYASRLDPGIGHLEYCHPEYDRATGRYLADLATRFPADLIVRAYASVLRIVELPFRPRQGGWGELETRGLGLVLVSAAIVLVTVTDARLGLFLLFFLLYFGGYPAIQFETRHYFHLEFITWWAAGFVLHFAIAVAWPLVRERRWAPQMSASVRHAAVLLTASAAGLVVILLMARAYQQARARSLFTSYLAAAKEEIAPVDALWKTNATRSIPRTSPGTDPERPTSCRSTSMAGAAARIRW
jgi:hypothetical protein